MLRFCSAARSDSPATRKRGLVSVDYSQGSKAKEPASGSGFLISLDDFKLLRVIGRGSYAKVLLVSMFLSFESNKHFSFKGIIAP